MMSPNYFSNSLIHWYNREKRDLPWRDTKIPYRIWLSEIILQQTRVEQGLPYFERFLAKYPTVNDLANATLDDVYKLWEGLGYYSRARNLHATAKIVSEDLNGLFPDNYKGLIELKGIGDYTASAIASFCFDEPTPVLDGNVFRVISRIYGIDEPINKPSSRKIFKAILHDLIDKDHPADFNQAIMEFGAMHCKPKNPLCDECPFADTCVALAEDRISELPNKIKAKKSINRFFNYLVIKKKKEIYLVKRTAKGIWLNLHEFPLIESEDVFNSELLENYTVESVSKPFKHILSHQNIHAKFYLINEDEYPFSGSTELVPIEKLGDYAMHRLMTLFLEESDWF